MNTEPEAPTPAEVPKAIYVPERPANFYRPDPRRRSVTLAVILSAMPGLGQVYLGAYVQGFLNITVVAALITLLNLKNIEQIQPFLGLFLAFYWLFNMLDAGLRASHLNQLLDGVGGKLPSEFPGLEERHGLLFAGVIMVLAGVLVLAHLLFGLSFHWVERWWPVSMLLVGGYLVWRGLDRKTPEE